MKSGFLLSLALGACGSRSDEPPPQPPPPPVAKRWAGDLIDASVPPEVPLEPDLIARLDALEPPYRAPPPTIRRYRQGDCRTSYAPRPSRDPNPMCRVTGGTFLMGGPIAEELHPAFSPNPVPVATTVSDFDIDQFEVTKQQAALFLNAHGNVCPGLDLPKYGNQTPCIDLGFPDDIQERDGRFVVPRGHELNAVNGFTWEGAMRYCAWVGKSVPSSAQWEYAARHDPKTGLDLAYPWGNAWNERRGWCTPIESAKCLDEERRRPIGRFDGMKERGDGTSPWGLHDSIANQTETLFACDHPDQTCHPGTGRTCPCRPLAAVAGYGEPAGNTVFARLGRRYPGTIERQPVFSESGYDGVRCARLR